MIDNKFLKYGVLGLLIIIILYTLSRCPCEGFANYFNLDNVIIHNTIKPKLEMINEEMSKKPYFGKIETRNHYVQYTIPLELKNMVLRRFNPVICKLNEGSDFILKFIYMDTVMEECDDSGNKHYLIDLFYHTTNRNVNLRFIFSFYMDAQGNPYFDYVTLANSKNDITNTSESVYNIHSNFVETDNNLLKNQEYSGALTSETSLVSDTVIDGKNLPYDSSRRNAWLLNNPDNSRTLQPYVNPTVTGLDINKHDSPTNFMFQMNREITSFPHAHSANNN
jgi:hypothetical protein